MRVLKGTYRITLYDFVTTYADNIRHLEYTREEAEDCIEMLNNGVLHFLKIYVINGKLKSCCKLISVAKDFLDNKFADKTGRFYRDYNNDERFYLAHLVKFDYMDVIYDDEEKVQRLVDLIGFIK